MRILVTGADGQLGTCLQLAADQSSNEYIFTDVDEIDILDADAVELALAVNDFDFVVNCAAYTNVDRAEEQPEIAERLNAEAVGNIARSAARHGVRLIHISTDYVFGGGCINTPIDESCATNPLGAYGSSKLHGEQAIAKCGCRAMIVRTAWLYSEFGKNFLKTMLDLTATRPELMVVADQIGTPTYARDLANAIVRIIDNGMFDGNEGIYHYSNEGVCSWFDFAKMLAETAGHTSCTIAPCSSAEFGAKATRPAFSVLNKSKFKTTFDIDIPYWVDSMRKCITNILSDEA